MKMFHLLLSALFLCVLSSCTKLSYIVEEYGGTEVVRHKAPDQTIRVFDLPEKEKMMVTPTVKKSSVARVGNTATLGLWKPGQDPFPLQVAAQDYLDSTGRDSEIISGKLLAKPQWEFRYQKRSN